MEWPSGWVQLSVQAQGRDWRTWRVAIALGWFSTGGAVVIGAVALMVGAFATAQALPDRVARTGYVGPGSN